MASKNKRNKKYSKELIIKGPLDKSGIYRLLWAIRYQAERDIYNYEHGRNCKNYGHGGSSHYVSEYDYKTALWWMKEVFPDLRELLIDNNQHHGGFNVQLIRNYTGHGSSF